ncbi:hypothetical protein [Variovorax paradoxus]|uniref:hypothetical protein n=1 Tax=Variovorax paradoxus TaxID=34073 RepID=UPI000B31BF2B|nr:hypothetical protein [Variovorax paradoxus]
MSTKNFTLAICKTCGLKYQPVNWLSHRVEGFCKVDCLPYVVTPGTKATSKPARTPVAAPSLFSSEVSA